VGIKIWYSQDLEVIYLFSYRKIESIRVMDVTVEMGYIR